MSDEIRLQFKSCFGSSAAIRTLTLKISTKLTFRVEDKMSDFSYLPWNFIPKPVILLVDFRSFEFLSLYLHIQMHFWINKTKTILLKIKKKPKFQSKTNIEIEIRQMSLTFNRWWQKWKSWKYPTFSIIFECRSTEWMKRGMFLRRSQCDLGSVCSDVPLYFTLYSHRSA